MKTVVTYRSDGSISPELVDPATGELIQVEVKEKRYNLAGGFLVMSLVNIKRLIDLQMSGDGYRLALSIAGRAAIGSNLVFASNADFAAELGISKRTVVVLMGKLRKAVLIRRFTHSILMVNPSWCFRGTAAQHNAAVEEWARLHPLFLAGKRMNAA